jgi:hypothetical protein
MAMTMDMALDGRAIAAGDEVLADNRRRGPGTLMKGRWMMLKYMSRYEPAVAPGAEHVGNHQHRIEHDGQAEKMGSLMLKI